MKIENLTSKRSGRAVANQFIIYTNDGKYFKSYDSIIVFVPIYGKVQLDNTYWNYSKTTGKYRNQFLNEDKRETERKIISGEYELVDLN